VASISGKVQDRERARSCVNKEHHLQINPYSYCYSIIGFGILIFKKQWGLRCEAGL
jgi:hypothetical protein